MMTSEDRIESEADISNDKWVKENFLDLVQRYPRQWIAVMDQRVIFSGIAEGIAESGAREIAGEREFSMYFIPETPSETDVGYARH